MSETVKRWYLVDLSTAPSRMEAVHPGREPNESHYVKYSDYAHLLTRLDAAEREATRLRDALKVQAMPYMMEANLGIELHRRINLAALSLHPQPVCPECGGTKRITEPWMEDEFGRRSQVTKPCPACNPATKEDNRGA